MLKFRPFEFEGFEHDNTYREQPVIKFELEYHFYGKKRDRAQHMIMFPAKSIPPANTSSKEFWFYPLILSKLTAPVLNIVARVFERHFHAYISPLQVAPSLLESVVQYYAMSSCEPLLNDDMYIGGNINLSVLCVLEQSLTWCFLLFRYKEKCEDRTNAKTRIHRRRTRD